MSEASTQLNMSLGQLEVFRRINYCNPPSLIITEQFILLSNNSPEVQNGRDTNKLGIISLQHVGSNFLASQNSWLLSRGYCLGWNEAMVQYSPRENFISKTAYGRKTSAGLWAAAKEDSFISHLFPASHSQCFTTSVFAKPHAWIAPRFPYPSWQTFMKRIYCSLWDNWKIQLKKGKESSSMKQMETWALVHHLSYFSQRRLLFLLSSSPCHEASLR